MRFYYCTIKFPSYLHDVKRLLISLNQNTRFIANKIIELEKISGAY